MPPCNLVQWSCGTIGTWQRSCKQSEDLEFREDWNICTVILMAFDGRHPAVPNNSPPTPLLRRGTSGCVAAANNLELGTIRQSGTILNV